jgi:alanine dehydrogenase
MLTIREADVQALLKMEELIPAVEAAFRDWAHARATNNPRRRLHTPQGTLHLMSAAWFTRGYLAFKSYTSYPGGTHFHVMLYSADSGEPLALIEADYLGQMRTGAASGVATKYLAREEAEIAGILGAGWQAEAQLKAICRVRPIKQVFVFSRDETRRHIFCERMTQMLGVPVIPASSAREAVQQADVIVTITTTKDPILTADMLKSGAHINAAGANSLARRELDTYVVTRCDRLFVDDVEQAKLEAAELLIPYESRRLTWERVQPFASLIGGLLPGRSDPQEITLFKSLGIALEDVAAASLIYESILQNT